MDLGPNKEFVQEVFDLFESDRLEAGILRGEIPIDPAPFEIETDYLDAQYLATSHDLRYEGYTIWSEIREWLISPVMYGEFAGSGDWREVDRWFESRHQSFEAAYREKFKAAVVATHGEKSVRFAGTISTLLGIDYRDIAFARYRYGTQHPFYEMMFSAYKQGGWPCGWKGVQPEEDDSYAMMPVGKMVVYHIGPKI